MLPLLTIGDVIRNVAAALGVGARTIVETSSTEIGTLAVKSADLAIDFDISSTQTTDGSDVGLRIRPGTLSISSDTERTVNQFSNHATLRLSIVSVLPDVEPAAATDRPGIDRPVVDPGIDRPIAGAGIDRPIAGLGIDPHIEIPTIDPRVNIPSIDPIATRPEVAARPEVATTATDLGDARGGGGLEGTAAELLPLLAMAVDELNRRLRDSVRLPRAAAASAAADLSTIRAAIDRGDPEGARKLLAVFARTYPQFRSAGQ